MKLDWMPIYRELASKLVDYEGRQKELLAMLAEIKAQGVPMIRLTDLDGDGNEVPLEEIDPFTFFAAFNRGTTTENRLRILGRLKERLQLQEPLPTKLVPGIPTVDAQQSWFFPYKRRRNAQDIPSLWALERQALRGRAHVDGALFDRCLEIYTVGPAKLSMGLYWFAPNEFLSCDRPTRQYLARRGVTGKPRDWPSYQDYAEEAKRRLRAPFSEIVYAAFDDVMDPDPGETAPQATRGPLNLILYGPPGTGKTYKLRNQFGAEYLATPEGATSADVSTQIEQLTWYQVIALALIDLGGEARAPGICEHRWIRLLAQFRERKRNLSPTIWGALQRHSVATSSTVHYANRAKGDLVFDKRADGTWHFPEGTPEDLKELHRELRALERTPEGRRRINQVFLTFHQSFAYENFIEGIKPQLIDADGADEESQLGYRLENGVFKRACIEALRLTGFDGSLHDFCGLSPEDRAEHFENAPRYAVFIDEINRGNVSRTFGELITLIEPDKRLGAENEMIVELPYSRQRFGVPLNLDLIGTMNTADRSVEALDTALRRRFAFQECLPQPDLLRNVRVGGIDVERLLQTINERLEVVYDRDHLIGHSYFLPLDNDPTIEHLAEIFHRHVIPLLQEYFYGDWAKIGFVLGRAFVRERSHRALAVFDAERAEDYADKPRYELTPRGEWTETAFRSVYETPNA